MWHSWGEKKARAKKGPRTRTWTHRGDSKIYPHLNVHLQSADTSSRRLEWFLWYIFFARFVYLFLFVVCCFFFLGQSEHWTVSWTNKGDCDLNVKRRGKSACMEYWLPRWGFNFWYSSAKRPGANIARVFFFFFWADTPYPARIFLLVGLWRRRRPLEEVDYDAKTRMMHVKSSVDDGKALWVYIRRISSVL